MSKLGRDDRDLLVIYFEEIHQTMWSKTVEAERDKLGWKSTEFTARDCGNWKRVLDMALCAT